MIIMLTHITKFVTLAVLGVRVDGSDQVAALLPFAIAIQAANLHPPL